MITLWGQRAGGTAAELLEHVLRREYGMTQLPEMARTREGKPWFPGHGGIHFNLSHSGDLVLCAVGEGPLGVDVEVVRPRRDGLPRYALSDWEYAWFESRGRRWEDFYTLWTLKEARVKQSGRGLDVSTRGIGVPLLRPGEAGEIDGLTFRAYGGNGWRAALCAAAPRRLPGDIFWVEEPG